MENTVSVTMKTTIEDTCPFTTFNLVNFKEEQGFHTTRTILRDIKGKQYAITINSDVLLRCLEKEEEE